MKQQMKELPVFPQCDPRVKQNDKPNTIAKILGKNSYDEMEVVVDEPCMHGDMEQEVNYEV